MMHVNYFPEFFQVIGEWKSKSDDMASEVEASQKEFGSLDKRLSNPAFVEKAKPEAVEKAKADAAFHASEIDRLRHALARLG